MTDVQRFSNALRILWNIDRDEVEFMTDAQWWSFRDNPHDTFVKFDEPTQQKIWAVIEARQPKEIPA